MKRLKKCMLLLMLAVFALGAAIPVQAKTETRTVTLYSAKDKRGTVSKNKVWIGSCNGKVSKLKSKNKAVASVTSETWKEGKVSGTTIYANLKKPGPTTISYQYKENGKTKTYEVKLKVVKYVNPISSIKLGKTTIKGAKFKNTSICKVNYAQYKNRDTQVEIKPAKGWSLPKASSAAAYNDLMRKAEKAEKKEDYDKANEYWEKMYNLPMKPSFEYFQKGWRKSDTEHNGKSVKVQGGKGFEIWVTLINNKTKQEEMVQIQFK